MGKRHLGQLIKKRRKTLEVRQTPLSEEIGVTQGTLSKIENGLAIPTFDVGLRICRRLRINLETAASAALK